MGPMGDHHINDPELIRALLTAPARWAGWAWGSFR